jgi:UDP-4-amino-4,6-dideoxy-N-acetyl-beta-L-altrosamine transaminase
MDRFLPYGRHHIDDEDIEAVVSVLKSNFLTGGPAVEAFEQAFAEKIGVKEAVVCSNGTTALHLAVLAADIQPDDLVIVPSVTFLSTANVVRIVGADVIFADVDPLSGLMTADTLKAAIDSAGKIPAAVMPVHLNGQACDMKAISDIAHTYDIKIITDCCHALGAEYTDFGKPGDGRFEDFGCFSLHPVKSIAMGEGGVVSTSDGVLAGKIRKLRSHGMTRDQKDWNNDHLAFEAISGNANPWYYEMHELGYNYRATDMQCALGLSQLKKLDQFCDRRRDLAARYDAAFKEDGLKTIRPVEQIGFSKSAWHLYPVLIDFKALNTTRAQVMNALKAKNIGSQVHYIPVHLQPYYQRLYGQLNLLGAKEYYDRVLSIPLYPSLTNDEQDYVIDSLIEVIK